MNTNFSTRIIQQALKCIPFFVALLLIFSCETKAKPQEVTMDYIFILEKTIDSLNLKVDSLNSRMSQLEKGSANHDLVSEMKAEERTVNRQIICPNCNGEGTKQETCGNCRGSGWEPGKRSTCLSCGVAWASGRQAKGYVNRTCNVCSGNGRISEYE